MCSRATCSTCGKATYTGCGQHIEEALRGVPADQRCSCPPGQRSVATKSLVGRLFGR